MTYQIYLKEQPVSVEPSTYYRTLESAEYQMASLEACYPNLAGKMEVRTV